MRILCCSAATGDYIASTIWTVGIVNFIGLIDLIRLIRDMGDIERYKIISYLVNIYVYATSFANI
jgi:hypothetical protein